MTPRLVAIVPAAGQSRRMGQPKLLLDLAGRTVIARVIEALRDAGITRCLVVVRPGDTALIQEITTAGGEIVIPTTAPADMRQSVEWALREVGSREPGVGSQNLPHAVSPPLPHTPTPPLPHSQSLPDSLRWLDTRPGGSPDS